MYDSQNQTSSENENEEPIKLRNRTVKRKETPSMVLNNPTPKMATLSESVDKTTEGKKKSSKKKTKKQNSILTPISNNPKSSSAASERSETNSQVGNSNQQLIHYLPTQTQIDNDTLDNNYSVNEIIKLSENNQFPKKLFIFGSVEKLYSPVLHFFECQTKYCEKPKGVVNFKCKIFNVIRKASFGSLTNLNKHLKNTSNHKTSNIWYSKYLSIAYPDSKIQLDTRTLDFIRFVISSNLPMSQLENPFFVNVIDPKIKIVNSYTFKNNYFQEIMKKLKAAQKNYDSLNVTLYQS